MSAAPKVLKIELKDRDVRADMTKILLAMSRIRQETIRNGKIGVPQKDEYLHLSYRLASGLKGIADKTIAGKMSDVAEAIDSDPRLLGYDPLQDKYWARTRPKFVRALDDLLIYVAREDFGSLDEKQHILQAVKYLAVEGAPFAEREKIYETIVPNHPPLPLNNKTGFARTVLEKIFGDGCEFKSDFPNLSGLALTIGGLHEDISDIVNMAEERGLSSIDINVPKKLAEREGMSILGEVNKPAARDGLVNKLIKYTKPVTYPFLGALPRRIQEKLGERFETFNSENANFYSNLIGGAFGGLSIVGGIIVAVNNEHGYNLALGLTTAGVGLASVIEAIVRGGRGWTENGKFERAVGSMYMKALFYPLDRMLKRREKLNFVSARKKIAREDVEQIGRYNPVSDFESVAKLEVPEDADRSLIWSTENHNQFGNRFKEYVGAKLSKNLFPSIPDRENQAMVYCRSDKVGEYDKHCALICYHGGERYIASAIIPHRDTKFASEAARILRDKTSLGERMAKMGKATGARFLHVMKYQNGELVEDMEGIQ